MEGAPSWKRAAWKTRWANTGELLRRHARNASPQDDPKGNLLVLDPATGKTLWHVNAGGPMFSSPMTYELDGRQYVVEGVQGVLYAWALPE
jgi:outer membrane protein assembly factor BamB